MLQELQISSNNLQELEVGFYMKNTRDFRSMLNSAPPLCKLDAV